MNTERTRLTGARLRAARWLAGLACTLAAASASAVCTLDNLPTGSFLWVTAVSDRIEIHRVVIRPDGRVANIVEHNFSVNRRTFPYKSSGTLCREGDTLTVTWDRREGDVPTTLEVLDKGVAHLRSDGSLKRFRKIE